MPTAPRLIEARLNMAKKKIADTRVLMIAINRFFQKLRVSLPPCAMLSASIRLTNPEDAVQIVTSSPMERNRVYPLVKSTITEKSRRREPWGRYSVVHCTNACQRFVDDNQPTMAA